MFREQTTEQYQDSKMYFDPIVIRFKYNGTSFAKDKSRKALSSLMVNKTDWLTKLLFKMCI